MIGYIKGTVFQLKEKSIILLNNDIGYIINTPQSLLSELTVDEEIELYTVQFNRDDKTELFGFAKEDDLNLFEKLISVNGVGPKSALEILSYPASSIVKFINDKDVKSLTKVKGIGKKTAERIILELKNYLIIEDTTELPQSHNSIAADIETTLISMGYKRNLIRKVYAKKPEEIQNDEEIISYLIQNL